MTKNRLNNRVGLHHHRVGEATIRSDRQFQPAQFLAISFVLAILLGTGLLLLPFSTVTGSISFIDALFTATSAVCVTGLIVQDTATYFSPLGQAIILALFQLGGLGIMTFSTLILLMAGKKVSITDRIILEQEFLTKAPKDVKSLIRNVFLYTLTFELVGTGLLFLCCRHRFPPLTALTFSLYHSVSAFCNAGFSLFSNSLESFRGDTLVNLVLVGLIVSGGMGFLVHLEGRKVLLDLMHKKRSQMSLHTKLVGSMTAFLILGSFLVFLIIEWNRSLQLFSFKDKLISSLFQVVTPRTAGFNTMALTSLSLPTIFLFITLMFIGASPGSTRGGVKTSTVGVILTFLRSKLAARDSVNVFYRTLPQGLVSRAYTVVTLSICVIAFAAFLLSLAQPEASMEEVFFEVFSAFGTVGLSLGLTAKLNTLGKLVILFTMYIGRIGPLVLLLAFSRRRALGRYQYVDESVMIG